MLQIYSNQKLIIFLLCMIETLLFAFDLQANPIGKDMVNVTVKPNKEITGKVMDSSGMVLPGVTIYVKDNKKIGTITDNNGRYILEVPDDAVLVFNFVGFQSQEVSVKGRDKIDISLNSASSKLGETVVVAFGKQKQVNVVGAVTTINPAELKTPSSNLTTALAGQLSGLIAYQRSGEPGQDNAEFFIRGITTFGTGKRDPLILIDGRESSTNDLARLQPDDIAGFSILKDATATSVYGARGANGVVLVTTKSGVSGQTKFNIRFENSISSNTKNFRLADNISFMNLSNEAITTRDPLGRALYSPQKIGHTKAGDNSYLYPNNDWIDQLVKRYTNNSRLNLNVSGGTDKAQFYIAGSYNIDNGILKTIENEDFNSNVQSKNYEIRSNIDMVLTATTKVTLRLTGRFSDYNGPIGGGSKIFDDILRANPVMFPAVYPRDLIPGVKHPLFGNSRLGGGFYNNPFANSVSGFQQSNTSQLVAQFEINQDFGFGVPGLSMRMMAYTERNSAFDLTRGFSPFYYEPKVNVDGDFDGLNLLNEKSATNFLSYVPGDKIINLYNYMEISADYSKTFKEKNEVTGMLIGILSSRLSANAGDLQSSLPYRNLGISGRFTYGHDHRYLFEFDFGYNGSERFAKNNRYGFFPSVGVGWNLDRENFWTNAKSTISKLKLRGTYGLVGNDQIGNLDDRFFYLSNVNMDDGGKGYYYGLRADNYIPGISINRYENDKIGWEKSYKADIGIDLGLFNDNLTIVFDVYKEHRTNILMTRAFIPETMGLNAPIQANVGEAQGKGVDLSADYGHFFTNKIWLKLRGTFTYATSKLLVNEEPDFTKDQKYMSRVGYSLNQAWGFVADRLFIDEKEVNNSPKQNYGSYMAGDLKYLDINEDGEITDFDMVPIGYPVVPEIIYGFGFSFGYGNFDVSAFAQGSARSSLFIDPGAIQPFVNQNGLLDVISQSHWSTDNRDSYAFWPRLAANPSDNNLKASTWWMRDGSFLRIKKVEVGYNFSHGVLNKIGIENLRVYANGLNLFAFSNFKLWDVEMGGNGLGYPIQRVFNIGVNLGF